MSESDPSTSSVHKTEENKSSLTSPSDKCRDEKALAQGWFQIRINIKLLLVLSKITKLYL